MVSQVRYVKPNQNFYNMKEKYWKDSAYYTKRFFSILNVCKKDHKVINYVESRTNVHFEVDGKTLTFNVSIPTYNLVLKLLHKAFSDNITYKFDISL